MDNRRKTIVINKKFQYQYALLIVALAVLAVNSFIIVRLLGGGPAPAANMAVALAVGELLLIGSIWYGSLRASHRIAGPVYVFAREVGRLGGGDLTASIQLREKDMFQDEAAQMNRSIAALRESVHTARVLAQQLHSAQSAGADTSALVQQLHTVLSGFRTEEEA